jgi:hypothetical protein
MPRKSYARLEPFDCSGTGCGNPVRQTKPSKSGLHFCKRPACQAEKQRIYAASRKKSEINRETLEFQAREADTALLIFAITQGERVQCPACGLMNAIPGWPHPDRESEPCFEFGQMRPSVTRENNLAVWPRTTRKYADVG